MFKRKIICLLCLLGSVHIMSAQCPAGTVVTVTNNFGTNVNGSFAWALDCLDNAGSTLTTVRFDVDGATEIQPIALAPLNVNKSGAFIDGANMGSGGSIIIDGSTPVGPAQNGLTINQTNVTVQGLIFQNFTSSSGGNGIFINSNGATVQNNRLVSNRTGIATGSPVFTFNIVGNTVGGSGEGNTINGISIAGAPSAGVISNNEIAFNGSAGISIIGGTVLITDNSIYCNTGSGITRPAPPALPNITLANTQLVRGTAAAGNVIEVFLYNTTGCAGTPVQGKTFLGNATTAANGVWTLMLTAGSVDPGNQVTATNTVNGNNTSGFAVPATVADCSGFAASINQTDITCPGANNGTATAIPTGSTFTYLWDNGATTATISNLSPGDYMVTITNSASCTATQSATITEPPPLTLGITTAPVFCFGGNDGAATANPGGGTPGYTFLWSNGESTADISGLAANTYTVTVTDQNSCTITQTTTIAQPTLLNVSISAVNVLCFGTATGTATATPSGSTPGYTFLWSNGQSVTTATGLAAGTYTVTVSDVNGCTATQSAVITQAPVLTLNLITTNQSTAGAADGAISAMPGGGVPTYTYAWSNGATTAQISNLAPGAYSVTVRDQNGCTISASTNVLLANGGVCMALPVYALLAPAEVCGNTLFTLEADDLYPNVAVKYVWKLPNGDSIVTIPPTLELLATSTAFSGEYFVLRDSAGCRSIAVGGAPVTVISLSNVFAGNDTVICSGNVISLSANQPSAGTGSWRSVGPATIDNPNSNNTTARNLQTGANIFIWQVTINNCPQAATDTFVCFLEKKPVANDDFYTLQRVFDVAVMEVLLNDALGGLSDTLLLQLSSPAVGTLELLGDNKRFRYTVDNDFRGNVSFEYTVCNPNSVCNLPCDTATVTIDVQNLPTVPTGLVVGDVGPNGALTIRGLHGFTRAEILITNRWGDLVFQETDYRNDNPWAGNYKNTGNYLPGGAYYYTLKVFEDATQIGDTLTGVIHLFEQ